MPMIKKTTALIVSIAMFGFASFALAGSGGCGGKDGCGVQGPSVGQTSPAYLAGGCGPCGGCKGGDEA